LNDIIKLKVEKRLLDSQGETAETGDMVKDLHEIVGDFPSAILKHIQALLLLDEVKGTNMIHGTEDFEKEDDSPGVKIDQDEPEEDQQAWVNRRDWVGLDSLHHQLDDISFNMVICGECIFHFFIFSFFFLFTFSFIFQFP
jgi:hypothetical protein